MKKSILAILLSISILACEKTNSNVEPTNITLNYLTGNSSKKWQISEGIISKGEITLNLIANQPPCITDNILVLYNSENYELLEGATKCDPSKDPDLILKSNFTYNDKTFSIDKLLFLGYVFDKPKFTITEISETKFKGKADIILKGEAFVANLTFKNIK